MAVLWNVIRMALRVPTHSTMPTDPHTPLPMDGPLNDRKPTDMPAARWMMIIVAVLLVIFALVAAFVHQDAQEGLPPTDQSTEQPISP
jgi:hypothetical protein